MAAVPKGPVALPPPEEDEAEVDVVGGAPTTIEAYLETLPDVTCDRLYAQPASCLAVLRLLPHHAKALVLRLLYVPAKVTLELVYAWYIPAQLQECVAALRQLQKLKIVKFSPAGTELWLSTAFQRALHETLTGTGGAAAGALTLANARLSSETLDAHAASQWERVLYYLVGTSQERPSKLVCDLLARAQLIEAGSTGAGNSLRIKSRGFQFLLLDLHAQLWQLLLQFLDMAESQGRDTVAYLELFFTLGTLEPGQAYSVSSLSPLQQQAIGDLQGFGLVYKPRAELFYATAFAQALTSGTRSAAAPGTAASDDEAGGFIILETNYRIYAYTDSPLQIAILGLFVSIRARLCNIVVGLITRESIRQAVQRGITAAQIIAYLAKNAHPEMRRRQPPLPVTVMDQVRLWEMERNRLHVEPGLIYFDFASDVVFSRFKEYAAELGVVMFCQDRQRRIVCAPFARDALKRRLQELKAEFGLG